MNTSLLIGIDVGSTTVKAIVTKAGGGPILWHDYRRHDGRQPEVLLDFLHRMEKETATPTACSSRDPGVTPSQVLLVRSLCKR
jgi:activator of 2-hydroxyglutaryl-CoA dehydratase